MSNSLHSQRVFHGSLDVSVAVSSHRSLSYSMTYTAGQYMYIGTASPFNNIWFEMSAYASSSAGTPTVQIWFNSQWTDAVDVIDQTSGMTASGRVSWNVDRLKGWQNEQDSATIGLSNGSIYNFYWIRLSWSLSFTATIGYMGQKFSTDTALASYYPDLMQASILDGFKSGKTNWDDQHFMVGDIIVRDLKRRNMIKYFGQMLDWSVFEEAGCHKCAEIVYQSFGTPYVEHAARARKRYEEEISSKALNIDENRDGFLSPSEKASRQGWLER